jgi:hypothetical protein
MKTPRLNERLLRLTIRNLLRESDMSAKPLALVHRLIDINSDLAEAGSDFKVGLAIYPGLDSGHSISFSARGPDGGIEPMDSELGRRDTFKDLNDSNPNLLSRIPYGEIVTRERDEEDDGPCAGARIVNYTNPTLKGWGPLLYDLALELSSQAASGLTPDRTTVSTHAHAVWDRYANSRGDVEASQLDRLAPDFPPGERARRIASQLTPDDPSDDCVQLSAVRDRGERGWSDSVLSRVYRKEGSTVMSALESAGLLWRAPW